MLERKYGDRSDWKRVIKREYKQRFLETDDFKGYITLLNVQQVSAPLFVQYAGKRICIVDDGYSWLQHFPCEKHYSLTTMFNYKGDVVQWYIDICFETGIEKNRPWLDDLFLDIVVLPSGEIILIDEDELEDALADGVIDESLYNMACEEADHIIGLIKVNKFELLKKSREHKELLSH